MKRRAFMRNRKNHGRRIILRILILAILCAAVRGVSLPSFEDIQLFLIKTGLNMSYFEEIDGASEGESLIEDKTEDTADTKTQTDNPLSISYEDDGNIRETTITGKGSSRYYESCGIYINNKTEYAVSAEADRRITVSSDGPQVLIIHTHGSEAYTPSGNDIYTESDPSRTEDTNYNVVRLGDELCKILNDSGIETVHDRTLHDYPSYNGSYGRSLESAKEYLKQYPTIKAVLDIHRDALGDESVTYKTVCDIEGIGKTAQLMLVVGTDYNGLEHSKWRENLQFAVALQKNLTAKYPTLCRPLTVSGSRYNQHLTSGSLIVEVGTNGNTLQEALNGIRLFAEGLIDMLK